MWFAFYLLKRWTAGLCEPGGPGSGGGSLFLGILGMGLKTTCWQFFRDQGPGKGRNWRRVLGDGETLSETGGSEGL